MEELKLLTSDKLMPASTALETPARSIRSSWMKRPENSPFDTVLMPSRPACFSSMATVARAASTRPPVVRSRSSTGGKQTMACSFIIRIVKTFALELRPSAETSAFMFSAVCRSRSSLPASSASE